mmetsp:Transcript_28009/g.73938  ORF Transcript_28009/g.73938 Transcript_28009/m.73938 type:complete len:330 (+) Transcript_28009:1834-2823(+)
MPPMETDGVDKSSGKERRLWRSSSSPKETTSSTVTPSLFKISHISLLIPKPSTWIVHDGSLPTLTGSFSGNKYVKQPDNKGSSQMLTRYGSASNRTLRVLPRFHAEERSFAARPSSFSVAFWSSRSPSDSLNICSTARLASSFMWMEPRCSVFTTTSCCRRCSISARRLFNRVPSISSFWRGFVLIFFTDCAKRRVDSVMLQELAAGEAHASITVLQLPMRDSDSRYVSLLLRYGMWFLELSGPVASFEMVSARVERLLLICLLSSCRAFEPPTWFIRSEPARSTQWKCARRLRFFPSCVMLRSTVMDTTACDREDCAFMFVDPTTRVW